LNLAVVVGAHDGFDVHFEFDEGFGGGFVESLPFTNSCQIRDLLNEIIDLEAAARFLDAAREEFAVRVLVVEAGDIIVGEDASGLRVVVAVGGPLEENIGGLFRLFAKREEGRVAWFDEDHRVGEILALAFDCGDGGSWHGGGLGVLSFGLGLVEK
jgi:hypothetical protein